MAVGEDPVGGRIEDIGLAGMVAAGIGFAVGIGLAEDMAAGCTQRMTAVGLGQSIVLGFSSWSLEGVKWGGGLRGE